MKFMMERIYSVKSCMASTSESIPRKYAACDFWLVMYEKM